MVTLNLMFDIGWSELLIIGVMALIVVGPKDLPVLLRNIGRYVGIIRRQASEFRAQFDEALRETEFDQIRKDVAGIKQDVTSTVHEATRQVERDLDPGSLNEPSTPSKQDKAAEDSADKGADDDADDVAEWAGAIEEEPTAPQPEKPVEVSRPADADANAAKSGV
ncbi:MAG: Sec-independent protein translocase protein TatB [Filomicrobium sp.]